jgi:hypothetical protein
MSRTLCYGGLIALALAIATPALAGFTVELPAEGAYNYDGTNCAPTATALGGRTVPKCLAAGVGTFQLHGFTRTGLAASPACVVDMVRFTSLTEPGSPSVAAFAAKYVAIVNGSTGAPTFASANASTVTKDLAADTACNDINESCTTGATTSAAILNDLTNAACATNACDNYDLVIQITYDGSIANTDTDVAITSVKLTCS